MILWLALGAVAVYEVVILGLLVRSSRRRRSLERENDWLRSRLENVDEDQDVRLRCASEMRKQALAAAVDGRTVSAFSLLADARKMERPPE